MLEVKKLSKYFGTKKAVSDLSFSVENGDILGFIGPNGAGKSTTMRIITGYLQQSAGQITVCGKDIEESPKFTKSKIGYLPENAPLYTNKTVYEFLSFIAEIRGFFGKEKKKKIEEVLEQCFLIPVKNQVIDTLSKGYRHRTCFAQSILHDPAILILDEPTDGLDPNQKREIRNLIKNMGKNKAIILSTHILEEVEAVTNRVLLIANGKKVYEGTPEDLKSNSLYAGSIILNLANKDLENAKEILTNIQTIQEVDILPESNNKQLSLRIMHSNKTRENIQKAILEKAFQEEWQVLELKIETGNLESVFADLTSNQSGRLK
jgi:ABC-2 type transport system ATP-binding protein